MTAGRIRDTLLRMLPHRAPTGLVRIGKPDRSSPVLLTGNFTLTVERMKAVLARRDAWLLCANSKGINVWCAAGGGHLTHHDVIGVIRTSHIDDKVDHREIILPQLCATGVERRAITEATGWDTRWGPARLEDLPAFLDRGCRVHKHERFMTFPLWERLEMAVMWGGPMLVIAAAIAGAIAGVVGSVAAAVVVVAIVGGLFALVPWLDLRGRARPAIFGLAALAGFALGAGVFAAASALTGGHVVVAGVVAVLSAAVLSVDIAGTTPTYPSSIITRKNEAHIDLLEERCTGAADCVQVCPRDVLEMNGTRRKVEMKRPEQCIQCGACIVQCPEDALRFRYDDGRVVEAATIRRTRMNMLGRRTVQVRE